MRADQAFLFEDDDVPARQGKAPRDGEADGAAADDDAVRPIQMFRHARQVEARTVTWTVRGQRGGSEQATGAA